MWTQSRFLAAAIASPARSALSSASPQSSTKMIAGGWVCAAMVRVVVMSIIWLSAGSTSTAAGVPAEAATAFVQISCCSRLARASSTFTASRSGSAR